MSTSDPSADKPLPERWLARHAGDFRGPTFVVFGGMHGNEPAGVRAIERVREDLETLRPGMSGTFIGLTGNRRALAQGVRFVQRDLNRRWFQRDVESLQQRSPSKDGPEDAEQRELLDILHKIIAGSPGPIVALDLHSTSSASPAFSVISDTLVNRPLAFALQVPVIFGLEEAIEGTMLGYLSDLGHIAVGFEGGQHDGEDTESAHVAAIWVGLVTAGLLPAAAVPNYGMHLRRLESVGRTLPRAVEILHRHPIVPGDDFRMRPGYVSFAPISAGEHVADDMNGQVRAPLGGRMLMPLYQGQGEDGFFIARELGPARLGVGHALRRARVDRLLPLVPGIERAPGRESHGMNLRVKGGLGQGAVRELLRLCGYRRVREDQKELVFSRRRQRGGG